MQDGGAEPVWPGGRGADRHHRARPMPPPRPPSPPGAVPERFEMALGDAAYGPRQGRRLGLFCRGRADAGRGAGGRVRPKDRRPSGRGVRAHEDMSARDVCVDFGDSSYQGSQAWPRKIRGHGEQRTAAPPSPPPGRPPARAVAAAKCSKAETGVSVDGPWRGEGGTSIWQCRPMATACMCAALPRRRTPASAAPWLRWTPSAAFCRGQTRPPCVCSRPTSDFELGRPRDGPPEGPPRACGRRQKGQRHAGAHHCAGGAADCAGHCRVVFLHPLHPHLRAQRARRAGPSFFAVCCSGQRQPARQHLAGPAAMRAARRRRPPRARSLCLWAKTRPIIQFG